MELTDHMNFGVEEEFGVVDRVSGALVPRADVVYPHAREQLGDAVDLELNLCQIEVGTPVCTTTSALRDDLIRLRRGLSSAAGRAGNAVLATGTHPFGLWQDQQVDVRSDRYRRMEQTYQIIARQQIICGMHVHVGIDDPEVLIQTMNGVRPWLSVLLALSANSPFWQGQDTGFASYRLQVWQRWPTAGMPPRFISRQEFDDLVAGLRSIDAIEDSTFLYWYVRPSGRFPTLEFRVCDVCLCVDDAVAVAALVRALAWTCARQAAEGAPRSQPRRELLEAAVWRAGRFGLADRLVSPSIMAPRPAAEVVAELLDFVREGLEAHGDWDEVSGLVEAIVRDGNGAVRQRAVLARRQSPSDVVAYAIAATVAPGPMPPAEAPSASEPEMLARGLFVYVAAYADPDDAMMDSEGLMDLHSDGDGDDHAVAKIHDAAIVMKAPGGTVAVHGAASVGPVPGVAAAALACVLFPLTMVATPAAAGPSGLPAWREQRDRLVGHFWRGLSRADVKELGEVIDDSDAAVIVVGGDRLDQHLAKTLRRAGRRVAKEVKGDIDDIEPAVPD